MDFEKTRGCDRERFGGFDENHVLIGQNVVSHLLFITIIHSTSPTCRASTVLKGK